MWGTVVITIYRTLSLALKGKCICVLFILVHNVAANHSSSSCNGSNTNKSSNLNRRARAWRIRWLKNWVVHSKLAKHLSFRFPLLESSGIHVGLHNIRMWKHVVEGSMSIRPRRVIRWWPSTFVATICYSLFLTLGVSSLAMSQMSSISYSWLLWSGHSAGSTSA